MINQVRARTVRNNSALSKIKLDSGCADCGVRGLPSWAYDFDHLRDKIQLVSKMLSHSPEILATEANKCEVVCTNCHRVRTHIRLHGTLNPIPPKKTRIPVLLRMWKALIDFKSRPCMDCKKTFHFSSMDCDHRDPTTKKGNISNMARNSSEADFLEELDKCDVVCSICHRLRTNSV